MTIRVLYNDGMIVYYEHNTAAWLDILNNWDYVLSFKVLFRPLFDGE